MNNYDNCHWKKLNDNEKNIVINNNPKIDELYVVDYALCKDMNITEENVNNNVFIVMFIKSKKIHANFSTYQYTSNLKCGFVNDKYKGEGQIINSTITLNIYSKMIMNLLKFLEYSKCVLILNFDLIYDVNKYIANIFINL